METNLKKIAMEMLSWNLHTKNYALFPWKSHFMHHLYASFPYGNIKNHHNNHIKSPWQRKKNSKKPSKHKNNPPI